MGFNMFVGRELSVYFILIFTTEELWKDFITSEYNTNNVIK